MQNIFKNFLFFISALALSASAHAAPQEILQKADSLYSAGRYVQAFEQYRYLLEDENKMSPAMLLKMSFIKEGLSQVDEALYYLNLYYLETTDERVLEKMEELADKNDLAGYDAGDFEFFISYYYRYYEYISLLLAVLAIFTFAIMVYIKRRGSQRPMATGIILIILLGLLFYQVNMGKDYGKGIISFHDTYVMEGPSAGAKVMDIVAPGHRVSVLGQEDVWTRINWQGKEAYVKNKNLREIKFNN